jgi:hypothetical protein
LVSSLLVARTAATTGQIGGHRRHAPLRVSRD